MACYETLGTFNTTSCSWDVSGTEPVQPILSSVIQPICSDENGFFIIENYDALYTYVVTPSTGVIITGNSISAPVGTYIVTATLGVDCASEDSSSVNVTVSLTADCDGDGEANITDPEPNDPCVVSVPNSIWNLFDCDGDGNPNGTDPNPLTPIAVDDGIYEVLIRGSITQTIINNDDFLLGNLSVSAVGGTYDGFVNFNPITGQMTYTPLDSEAGTTVTIVYSVCNNITGVCAEATITIAVLALDGIGEIFNGITPSSTTGENDEFFIENIDLFPQNKVEIYNRWGVLVYQVEGYNNNDKAFKGISEGRETISKGEQLPSGTYFYLFQYVDNKGQAHEKQGYLYLTR